MRSHPPAPSDLKPAKAPPHLADGVSAQQRIIRGLTLHCPICWRGKMFRHPLAMNDACAECGWTFDRGNGYFVGAMYFSYWLAVAFGAVVVLLLWALDAPMQAWPFVVGPLMLAFGPLVAFPYSRLMWIWSEQRTLYWTAEDDATILFRHRSRAGKSPLRVVNSELTEDERRATEDQRSG